MNRALPQGWTHQDFDSLDSTNSEAIRQAQSGAPHGVWMTAAQQTAGRGRRGRVWLSPPGNLIASVLLRPVVSVVRAGELSLVTAVALGEALAEMAPHLPISFKWPNDVQVQGAKLAGILLESAAVGQTSAELAVDWVVAGVGVNVAGFPSGLPYPATSLAAQGVKTTAADLFGKMAFAFAAWYDRWLTEGFSPVRTAWLARAARLGQDIAVRRGDQTVRGVFDGLDPAGGLLLGTADGPVVVTSGEVL